jgi:polysaccharide export outer membrane protein
MVSCAGTGGVETIRSDEMGESTAGGTYDLDDPFRKGDFVQITLAGVPDGGKFSERVDENGNISMPHLGSFRAEGLNTVQLKEKIEAMYRLAQIYTTPVVSVQSQQARFITVTGDVRGARRIYYSKDLTVLGAIATCGGFTNFADRDQVKILRGDQVIIFDAKAALKDPRKDMAILPDDKIFVPRSPF